MAIRHALALVLVFSLSGCVEVVPAYDPEAAPDSSKNAEGTNWQGNWDTLRSQLGKELGSASHLLHQSAHLALHGLIVRDPLAAPARDAAEVLIVVEGLGVLKTQTAIHALEPGTVAILDAGARREIRALGGELSGLLLRSASSSGSSSPVADQVFGYREAFPISLDPEGSKENLERMIGLVPGVISARALSIGGIHPRHMHVQHDEVLFLLQGWGTMGLGGHGESRNFVSYPLRERSIVFMDPLSTHGFRDEEGRTFALSIHGGPNPAAVNAKDSVAAVERAPLKRHSLGHRNQLKKSK